MILFPINWLIFSNSLKILRFSRRKGYLNVALYYRYNFEVDKSEIKKRLGGKIEC